MRKAVAMRGGQDRIGFSGVNCNYFSMYVTFNAKICLFEILGFIYNYNALTEYIWYHMSVSPFILCISPYCGYNILKYCIWGEKSDVWWCVCGLYQHIRNAGVVWAHKYLSSHIPPPRSIWTLVSQTDGDTSFSGWRHRSSGCYGSISRHSNRNRFIGHHHVWTCCVVIVLTFWSVILLCE